MLHLLLPSGDSSASPRQRKRKRVDDDAMDVEMEDTTNGNANGSLLPLRRGVELETTAERFLLRMYDAGTEADEVETDGIAGASEDVIDEGADKQPLQGANNRRRWEIWLLGTLDADEDAEKPGDRPPPLHPSLAGGDGAVLLQRGLCAENLEFVEGEVRVLQTAAVVEGDSETNSGAREGWAIEVRRWRWARW